jgi:hypothetical protein
MAHVIKAPYKFSGAPRPMVFLAGSIELGEAPDWQQDAINAFAPFDITVLSPRRDDFDTSQEQSIDNDYFREQVEWELAALQAADMILLYFAPGTKSPICLLELGLFAASGKLVVCCPPLFWKRGNIEIVCLSYGIPFFETIEEGVAEILERLG